MKSCIEVALLAALMIGNQAVAEQDNFNCGDVLERWAVEPEAVDPDRVEYCKGVKGVAAWPVGADSDRAAAAAAALAAATASTASADPCSGPNAGASAHCWGPWSALAPAAAGGPGAPQPVPTDLVEQRPELASNYGPNPQLPIDPPIEPPLPPDVPLGACEVGLSCGFATIVDGTGTVAPADDTTLGRFDVSAAGGYVIRSEGNPDIALVTPMAASFSPRNDEYENLQAIGVDGDFRSLVLARVIRNNGGEVTEAADVWINGNSATAEANSGYFAWGTAMSQAGLDELNAGNGVAGTFSGFMSVDSGTLGTITVDFGSQPSWVGTWANPAFSFDAGGVVVGPDLVSEAGSFSGNVGADSYVRGSLLGQPDNKSIAHVIDVDVAGVGRVRDVGLLREQLTP